MAENTSGNGSSVGDVFLRLGVNLDDIKKDLDDAKEKIKDAFEPDPVEDFDDEVDKSDDSINKLTSTVLKLGAAIGAAFAIDKLTDFLNTCEDLTKVQQYAEQNLERAMTQRMNATQAEIQEIKNLASELQGLGIVGDEVAMAGATQLAYYTKSVDTLKTMLPLMEDLAVLKVGTGDVSSTDMKDIGRKIGEAISKGTIDSLSELGLSFTESELNVWKTLTTESEKINFLASSIRNSIGSVNQSLSETLSVEKQLSNTTGDIKEKVGSLYQLILVPTQKLLLNIATMVDSTLGRLSDILGLQLVSSSDAINTYAENTSNYFEGANKQAEKLKTTLMGFDVIQKLGLTADDSGLDSALDSIGGDSVTQTVKFDYEEGGFADRIRDALSKIGQGISDYIGDKFGVAFDAENIENFVQWLENLGNWIEEHPDEFANLIDGAITFVKVLASLAIISSVINWLGQLSFSVTNLAGLFKTLGPILTNPWTLLIGTLAVVGATLWSVRDDIWDAITGVFKLLTNKEYQNQIIDSIAIVMHAFTDWFQRTLTNLWNMFINWLNNIGTAIGNLWNKIFDGAGGQFSANVTTGTPVYTPHFATGGFLEANTPTLAVVGDNRRQGEFVLTESQFADAADKYGGGNNSEVVAILREILAAIPQNLTAEFDLDRVAKFVLRYARQQERATGKPAFG